MIVYVEYVILNNLLANYAVIVLTRKFSGIKPSKIRLSFCLIISTVFGTFSPLLVLPDVVCSLLKVGISCLLVAILTGRVKIKRYLLTVFIFYGSSFGVAGAVTALLSFTSFGVSEFTDTELTFCILSGSLVFSYIAKQVVTYIKNRADKGDTWVKIQGKDNFITLHAFIDSGNQVSFRGRGVTFISKNLIDKIDFTDLDALVTVKTVTGEENFQVFSIRKMIIGTKVKENFPAIFWDKKGEYDIILHGGENEQNCENN